MRTLGRVAAQRQRRIEQQVEPVERLLEARTALRTDRTGIGAGGERGLHYVDDPRQAKPGRMLAEMWGTVREEILAERLGRNVALADIGALAGRQPLLVPGRRQDAEEVDLGIGRHEIAGAVLADAQPIDLLDRPAAVRKERLPALVRGRDLLDAVGIPGTAIGLARHVRQGIETIVRAQLDFIHGLVAGALTLAVKIPPGVEVTVRRAVKLGGVGLERMGAELLDIHD